MKTIRAVLILLLCFVLPISGMAATGSTGWCPMQTSSHAGLHEMAATSMAMPACAMSADSHDDNTQPTFCKYMAQCATASVYHAVSVPAITRPAGVVMKVRFFYSRPFAFHPSAPLWRPPRSV